MAFTTTPILSLKKPDVTNSIDVWGEELNDSLDILDAHNHQEDALNAITPAAMDIDAALDFNSQDLTSLAILGFAATAASAIGGSLWRRTSDNELIWRTAAGVDVQLTSGNSLNASLLQGITGDYSTSPAVVTYSNSTKIYKILQDVGPDHWGNIDVGEVSIYEAASGVVNAVKLRSPASLAAGYSITLPAALPAELRGLSCDAAGVVEADDAHGPKTLLIPAALGQPQKPDGSGVPTYRDVSSTLSASMPGSWASSSGGAYDVDVPILLHEGDRITDITAWIEEGDAALSEEVRMELYEIDPATTSKVRKGPEKVSGTTGGFATLVWSSADADFPLTLAADRLYVLSVQFPTTSASVEAKFAGAKVTYDRPR